MIADAIVFQNCTPCSGDYMVRIADASFSKVLEIGPVVISKDLTFDSLLTPNLVTSCCPLVNSFKKKTMLLSFAQTIVFSRVQILGR